MERTYTVALHGGAALPAARRIAAEIGFITAIERTLGGPRHVAESYRAYLANGAHRAGADLAQRWAQAYEAASRDAAGAQGIGDGARFELRLTDGEPGAP